MINTSHSRAVRLGFGIATGVLAWVSVCASWSAYTLFKSFKQVSQAHEVVAKFQHVQTLMESAYSGVSGYVLTGDADRLNGFYYANLVVAREVNDMRKLLPATQQGTIPSLQNALERRLKELSRVVKTRETRGQAASIQLLTAETGASRYAMERLLTDCQLAYAGHLQNRSEKAQQRSRRTQGWLALATLISLALVGWTYILMKREAEEREQAEDAKGHTEALLNSVIERIPYMIFVKDANALRVTLANPAASAWLGKPEQQLLGALEQDFRPSNEARTSGEAERTALNESGTVEINERLVITGKPDRELLTLKIPLLDREGQPKYVLSISEDVTQRKQAERMLELSRDAAVESARLRSEFIRNMSHEFRTPLSVVMGMSSLMLDTSLTTDQKHFATTIKRSAEGLAGLVKNILDFSKIETGSFSFENREMNILQVVEEVSGMVVDQAKAKNVGLVTLASPSVPAVVRGDSTRLRQVLMQLISNAVKFTEKGQISIRVMLSKQTESQIWVRFQVTDTGIGISEDVQKYLFQPFRQGDGSWTRRYGGTGLGLAMAKRVVELMGGEIGFESASNMGSTFWFTVPLNKRHVHGPDVHMATQPWARERVMLISENETTRKLIQQHLQDCALGCEVVSSGQAAIEILRREQKSGHTIAIVLLDMHLADMDAVHFAKAIRHEEALKNTKLALLSSGAGLLDAATLGTLGFAGVLKVPCQAQALYEEMAKWVGTTPSALQRKSA